MWLANAIIIAMFSTLLLYCASLAAVKIATASVVRLDCLDSINVCQAATVKFVCHITGDVIEWGNTSSRIRLGTDFSVGAPATQEKITAVVTSRNDSGLSSEYRINVTPGAQFGDTVIYCEDRGDGDRMQCPPTVITPVLPPSPTNLMLSTTTINTATIQWSSSTEVSVSSYSITITPAPATGTCSGGSCSVSTQNCPTSNPSCRFAITDLQRDQGYSITVRSVNCLGSSSPMSMKFIIQNPSTIGIKTNVLESLTEAVMPSSTVLAIPTSSTMSTIFPPVTASTATKPPTTHSLLLRLLPPTAVTPTNNLLPSASSITSTVIHVQPVTASTVDPTIRSVSRPQSSVAPIRALLPSTSPNITFSATVITADNQIKTTQSLLDTITSAKPSQTHGVTPVITNSVDINEAEVFPIQWIVLGVVVPSSIIITAIITTFIVWCCLRRSSQLKQTTQTVSDEENALDLYRKELQRKSEPVYSQLSYDRESLVYNLAYQHSISLCSNPAYQSSLPIKEIKYKLND